MPPKVRRAIAKRARPDAPPPTPPRCDLMCDGIAGGPLLCCGKRLCVSCETKMLDHEIGRDVWYIVCPFCRKRVHYTAFEVKHLLAENCPHHSKALGEHGDVVVHMPNAAGHYDHPDSQLLVHRVADYAADEEHIDLLNEEIEHMQDRVTRLVEQNRRLLEQNRQAIELTGRLNDELASRPRHR